MRKANLKVNGATFDAQTGQVKVQVTFDLTDGQNVILSGVDAEIDASTIVCDSVDAIAASVTLV